MLNEILVICIIALCDVMLFVVAYLMDLKTRKKHE